MRKKTAVGVGLGLLTVAVAVLLALWLLPSGPSLRVGMNDKEVHGVLGDDDTTFDYTGPGGIDVMGTIGPATHYSEGPDWLGNRQEVKVHFDDKKRVTGWETKPLPRYRPPWLDRAMKAIGL